MALTICGMRVESDPLPVHAMSSRRIAILVLGLTTVGAVTIVIARRAAERRAESMRCGNYMSSMNLWTIGELTCHRFLAGGAAGKPELGSR